MAPESLKKCFRWAIITTEYASWAMQRYYLLFHSLFLSFILIIFSIIGGALFMVIEAPPELKIIKAILRQRNSTLTQLRTKLLAGEKETEILLLMQLYEGQYIGAISNGTVIEGGEEKPIWTFAGSVYYCVTTFLLVGYGNLAPKTDLGRVIAVIYCGFTVPVTSIINGEVGEILMVVLAFSYNLIRDSISLTNARITGMQGHQKGGRPPRRRSYSPPPSPPRTRQRNLNHNSSCLFLYRYNCPSPVPAAIDQPRWPNKYRKKQDQWHETSFINTNSITICNSIQLLAGPEVTDRRSTFQRLCVKDCKCYAKTIKFDARKIKTAISNKIVIWSDLVNLKYVFSRNRKTKIKDVSPSNLYKSHCCSGTQAYIPKHLLPLSPIATISDCVTRGIPCIWVLDHHTTGHLTPDVTAHGKGAGIGSPAFGLLSRCNLWSIHTCELSELQASLIVSTQLQSGCKHTNRKIRVSSPLTHRDYVPFVNTCLDIATKVLLFCHHQIVFIFQSLLAKIVNQPGWNQIVPKVSFMTLLSEHRNDRRMPQCKRANADETYFRNTEFRRGSLDVASIDMPVVSRTSCRLQNCMTDYLKTGCEKLRSKSWPLRGYGTVNRSQTIPSSCSLSLCSLLGTGTGTEIQAYSMHTVSLHQMAKSISIIQDSSNMPWQKTKRKSKSRHLSREKLYYSLLLAHIRRFIFRQNVRKRPFSVVKQRRLFAILQNLLHKKLGEGQNRLSLVQGDYNLNQKIVISPFFSQRIQQQFHYLLANFKSFATSDTNIMMVISNLAGRCRNRNLRATPDPIQKYTCVVSKSFQSKFERLTVSVSQTHHVQDGQTLDNKDFCQPSITHTRFSTSGRNQQNGVRGMSNTSYHGERQGVNKLSNLQSLDHKVECNEKRREMSRRSNLVHKRWTVSHSGKAKTRSSPARNNQLHPQANRSRVSQLACMSDTALIFWMATPWRFAIVGRVISRSLRRCVGRLKSCRNRRRMTGFQDQNYNADDNEDDSPEEGEDEDDEDEDEGEEGEEEEEEEAEDEETEESDIHERRALVPTLVTLTVTFFYIGIGAAALSSVSSQLSYFDSFWFIFISIVTIGYGDVVPTDQTIFLTLLIYLFFGMSLMTNVITDTSSFFSSNVKKTKSIAMDAINIISTKKQMMISAEKSQRARNNWKILRDSVKKHKIPQHLIDESREYKTSVMKEERELIRWAYREYFKHAQLPVHPAFWASQEPRIVYVPVPDAGTAGKKKEALDGKKLSWWQRVKRRVGDFFRYVFGSKPTPPPKEQAPLPAPKGGFYYA